MRNALQVSQINKIIKDIVDNEIILESVKVIGEISSFSITRGTAYFVLKDADSMLSCVMFNCKSNFNIGDSVVVQGAIKYYSKGGKLSLNCFSIEHSGLGELYQKFVELKNKLESEGLFDAIHKKPIPSYIKKVGVVTSKTGAVIQDIINVRTRRNPNLDIVLYDAQVQGLFAKQQIIEGINYFSEYEDIDCIIVARGGGSIEDLQPFNEEDVARAVYACKKPIISAVGHETDFTIIDFVADLRAPTPSAAAELITYDCNELKNTIKFYQDKIVNLMKNIVIDNQMLLNETLSRIDYIMNDYVNNLKVKINSYTNMLDYNIDNILKNTSYRINMCLSTLDNLNPAKVMAKGFSGIKKEGIFQKDYSNLKISDIITIENNCQELSCEVLDKKEK